MQFRATFVRSAPGLLGCVDLELFELRGDVLAGSLGADVFVDGENLAVLANIEGVSVGEFADGGDGAECLGDLTFWIRQDRVVELQ